MNLSMGGESVYCQRLPLLWVDELVVGSTFPFTTSDIIDSTSIEGVLRADLISVGQE